MRDLIKIITLCSLLLGFHNIVLAQAAATKTTSTQASATLSSFCTLTTNNINFGEVGPSTATVSYSSGAVNILCSNNLSYSLSLTDGGNQGVRYLLGLNSANTSKIPYNLCTISSCVGTNAVIGSNDVIFFTGIGSGTMQTEVIYGSVKNGYYTPDIYSNNITVTVSY